MLKLFARLVLLFSLPLVVALPAAADEQGEANEVQPGDLARLKEWKLLEPFWSTRNIHRESVLFVRGQGKALATARLLLPVEQLAEVASADRTTIYTAGNDFTLDAGTGTLTLSPVSRIPFLEAESLFPPKNAPRSIAHKAGDANRGVLFENQHWFHDQQVEVTYRAASDWTGSRPQRADELLPKTLARLNQKKPLTIGVSGDSISFGYNASGSTGAAPHMPNYPQLVAQQLQASFGSPIKLVNRAVGGWRVEHGLEDLPELLAAKPDLVIIAYGMNHFGSQDPAGFRQLLAKLVDGIKTGNPDTEIILVSPMYGNAEWSHTPRDQFAPHRDAIVSLVGPGVALADLTTLWGQMLLRKRDSDLTGNGVNHPNDFGHRVYAQAILGLLLEPAHAKP